MHSKTLECQSKLDMLCKKVFPLDKGIELVAVLSNRGRVAEMTFHNDWINRELTVQKKEMLFMECALQTSLNREFDSEFGQTNYSILKREKSIVFSFQIDEHVLMIITKPVIDIITFQQKIAEVISNYTGVKF
jgi:uncharacterized protein DUF6659